MHPEPIGGAKGGSFSLNPVATARSSVNGGGAYSIFNTYQNIFILGLFTE